MAQHGLPITTSTARCLPPLAPSLPRLARTRDLRSEGSSPSWRVFGQSCKRCQTLGRTVSISALSTSLKRTRRTSGRSAVRATTVPVAPCASIRHARCRHASAWPAYCGQMIAASDANACHCRRSIAGSIVNACPHSQRARAGMCLLSSVARSALANRGSRCPGCAESTTGRTARA